MLLVRPSVTPHWPNLMSTLSHQDLRLLMSFAFRGTRGAVQHPSRRVAMPTAAIYVLAPIVRRRAPIAPAGTAVKNANVAEVLQDLPPVPKLAVREGFVSCRVSQPFVRTVCSCPDGLAVPPRVVASLIPT